MFSQKENSKEQSIQSLIALKNKISHELEVIAKIQVKSQSGSYYNFFGLGYTEDYLDRDMSSLKNIRRCINEITTGLFIETEDQIQEKDKAKELLIQIKKSYKEYVTALKKLRKTPKQSLQEMHKNILQEEENASHTLKATLTA
jgi:hypothetical protein